MSGTFLSSIFVPALARMEVDIMEHNLILSKISTIAGKYTSAEKIEIDIPLTSEPYYLDARSLTAVFIDIEREFKVDLNKIFSQPMDYSLIMIANAVVTQL